MAHDKTQEALKLALEALESGKNHGVAIDVLRRALAEQPAQQEPVAWKDRTYGNLHHQDFGNSIPLYTSPPASKPLTPLLFSRRKAIADKLGVPMDATFNAIVRKVEAEHGITIEAAHGIKGDA